MRVLLVTSRFPYPTWRGNQVRTAEWLEAMQGYERLLVAPFPEAPNGSEQLRSVGVAAELFSLSAASRGVGLLRCAGRGLPLQEGLYGTTPARRALERALERGPWDVAVVQMIRCGWALQAIRTARPQTAVVFDAIDAMGLHYRRSVANYPAPLRPLILSEARRCSRREAWMVGRAEVVTAVARRDLEALAPAPGSGRVVPVAGKDRVLERVSGGTPTVLLSGNLGYRPTARGALWFAREVWPELRRRLPQARWVLAGARPGRAVRRLARLPGVEVHANVPDLAPFLAAASVAVAPMATGSGVPMKVLEAWAVGVPVVAHPWAADGLVDEPEPGVVTPRSAEEWAVAVARLATDPGAAAELAERGRAIWREVYHPNRVRAAIREAVTASLSARPGPSGTHVPSGAGPGPG